MRSSFTAYQITQAFRQVRELLAIEHDVDFAEGETFSIRQVELMVMDVLQPSGLAHQKNTEKVASLKDMTADELNDALFG